MNTFAEHWNTIYRETDEERLGWYEDDQAPTFDLLNQVSGWEKSLVFLPGIGTSILADRLIEKGARLIVNDLSSAALDLLSRRLGESGKGIESVCQTIAEPLGDEIPKVDLWIDRAVLHFLTDESEIEGYFKNLKNKLKPDGYVLFAEFARHGSAKCAGLDLHRYSLEELQIRLGNGFEIVDHFDHTYISPAGERRPYIYGLFHRKEAR